MCWSARAGTGRDMNPPSSPIDSMAPTDLIGVYRVRYSDSGTYWFIRATTAVGSKQLRWNPVVGEYRLPQGVPDAMGAPPAAVTAAAQIGRWLKTPRQVVVVQAWTPTSHDKSKMAVPPPRNRPMPLRGRSAPSPDRMECLARSAGLPPEAKKKVLFFLDRSAEGAPKLVLVENPDRPGIEESPARPAPVLRKNSYKIAVGRR